MLYITVCKFAISFISYLGAMKYLSYFVLMFYFIQYVFHFECHFECVIRDSLIPHVCCIYRLRFKCYLLGVFLCFLCVE